MTLSEMEIKLFKGPRMANPIINGNSIEEKAGYYAIWITNIEKLPIPFSEELFNRKSNLLYIGIGTGSLLQRLYQQELQHKKAATFFRSIGAALGYKTEPNSLKEKKYNYKFNKSDTKAIIEWINLYLEISFCYGTTTETPFNTFEETLIKKYNPLLNLDHSPKPFLPLKFLRNECRLIAWGSAEVKQIS